MLTIDPADVDWMENGVQGVEADTPLTWELTITSMTWVTLNA